VRDWTEAVWSHGVARNVYHHAHSSLIHEPPTGLRAATLRCNSATVDGMRRRGAQTTFPYEGRTGSTLARRLYLAGAAQESGGEEFGGTGGSLRWEVVLWIFRTRFQI